MNNNDFENEYGFVSEFEYEVISTTEVERPYDKTESDWTVQECYPINRKVWQPLWEHHFAGLSANYEIGYDFAFNNDTFEVQLYNWFDDDTQEYTFWHKPSGYKMFWYKYPLRGTTANMDITADQFVDILRDCRNSILACRRPKITYDVDRWWENENN